MTTAGFQVYDASGNLITDLGTNVMRILGVATTTASSTGSVTGVSGFSDGTGFYCVVPVGVVFSSLVCPTVTISGTTISWSSTPTSVKIIYGVY